MPVIRIGNYKIPGGTNALHGREDGAKKWRSDVRLALWKAIKKVEVPGLEDRESVTFVFENEWEPDKNETADPKIAYVFIEGFEDRDDRPVKMCKAMAHAIGQALVEKLEVRWSVEVFPRHYNSEHEGATVVGSQSDPPGTGYLPRHCYKFCFLVFQDGEFDEEVETPVREFESEEALLACIIAFAAQSSSVAVHSAAVQNLWADGKLSIYPPITRRGLSSTTTLIIKEVIRVDI